MDITTIKKDINDMLLRNNNITPKDIVLKDDTLLSEYGVDSVVIVDLIVTIEEKYDFEFSTNDLNLRDFETINSISLLIYKLVKRNIENS